MRTYRTEITINMYDDESGRTAPAVQAAIHIDVDELEDPRDLLAEAALTQALELVSYRKKYFA